MLMLGEPVHAQVRLHFAHIEIQLLLLSSPRKLINELINKQKRVGHHN